MKKITVLFLLLFIFFSAKAQINVVPMPASVKMGKGTFVLNKNTVIVLEGSHLERTASIFNDYLLAIFGYKLKVANKPVAANTLTLNYERIDNELEGAYHLSVDKKGIYIAGDNEAGVFYGLQTLKQLMSVEKDKAVKKMIAQFNIPYVTISDDPRFAYRGMHLDVTRHFFTVKEVKRYIDHLAAYKFNNFHWHLTDDQGWRIEIKKYPELTTTGANRNGTLIGRYPGKGNDNKPYSGFYTQEQIKEVVKYAKERHIEVIPEIEIPGHSSAAIAAYPWLSCFPQKPTEIPANMISQKSIDEQKAGRIKLVQETWGVFDDVFCAGRDATFKFLENVLDEVSELFPGKYVHIGGDESPKTHWMICPACQERMKNNNLKDEHALQSWFIQRIEKYLNSKGKTIIGWDEILEGGLAPNAVVMSWRGEKGGIEAAKEKHQVIMTPGEPLYFDHTQSKNEDSITFGGYNPIENVYAYEPVSKELNAEQGKYILGAQANMWTEYMEYPSKIEYQMFPRIAALSEVLWTPKEKRDWKDFERRLPGIFDRLNKQNINFSKAYYDLKATVLPTENYDGVLLKLESKKQSDSILVKKNIKSIDYYSVPRRWDEEIYSSPVLVKEDNRIQFNLKKLSTLSDPEIYFHFNKATGKKITLTTEADKKYPGDGAFTLVDGVQNEKGMAKSSEFLGFNGTDMEAFIDLGNTDVNKITIHVLDQNGSWIYLPSQVEVTYLPDFDLTAEIEANAPKTVKIIDPIKDKGTTAIVIESKQQCRYVRIVVKNFGIIPQGNPGAGNPAWLFVDEIEIE